MQNCSLVLDLSRNISEFDGLSGAANARVWLKQLESTVKLHRWTEPIAFETARSRLVRAPKNWYVANTNTITNRQLCRKAFSNTALIHAYGNIGRYSSATSKAW